LAFKVSDSIDFSLTLNTFTESLNSHGHTF